ncbi:hypothetical protein BC940DRAFT_287277 [Gongronella butleri]|nr:hypothetical protein BC940DRAFT_287277 [Gongronella butleri]
MAAKNQYNVLVDMEDSVDYTQPATIESDGLEFQDFSNDTASKTTSLPPPAATPAAAPAPRSSFHNKPMWSLDYYSRFFDVDTSQVVERCLKSMYPVGDFANDTLEHQPDLYGPFWITTTVVFAVFVCSSLAGSLAAYMNSAEYEYDFRQLSYAVFVIYSYTFITPVVMWASTKYFGCQPSLLEIVDYYGYSMTVWVPISMLCVIPIDIARWVFVGVAFGLTAYFLVKNLYTIISRADAKTSRMILIGTIASHAVFCLVLKIAFYSYSVQV